MRRRAGDVAPDRRIDAVLRPDRAVGEAYLAAEDFLAARLKSGAQHRQHALGLIQRQAAGAGRERRQRLARRIG
ncbi:MAG: hypothetical protein NTZ72_19310, partial [Afipia sp.]|nr:hypothetical protein [Afipia sp.]